MSALDDISRERIEATRFAQGHLRDIHAVCDMATRWLDTKATVEGFARSLSMKDYVKLVRALEKVGYVIEKSEQQDPLTEPETVEQRDEVTA